MLNVSFHATGTYNLGINVSINGKSSYVSTTVKVMTLPPPVITGPETMLVNQYSTFSVTEPNGYTFLGWTVSSGPGATIIGQNDLNMQLACSDNGPYHVYANFRLSDGSNYSVQKNIRAVSLPLIKPVLGFSNGSNHYVFYNRNYYQYGVFYQWQINGMLLDPTLEIYQIAIRRDGLIETSGSVSVLGNLNLDPYYPTQLNVRCRAVLVVDGTAHQYSDWSDWVSSQ